MSLKWFRPVALLLAAALLTSACASVPPAPSSLLAPTEAQMKLRNMQTREFDVADRMVAMRGVIAALFHPLSDGGLQFAARKADVLSQEHKRRAIAGPGGHVPQVVPFTSQLIGRRLLLFVRFG
jgi:hypothetical protein